MLTGGEPMLDYKQVIQTARIIRAQNPSVPIFVYTAKTEPSHELGWVLSNVDGVTVTIHEEKDIEPFLAFARYADLWKMWKFRSLRVNVFKPMKLPVTFELRHWIIKDQMEWIVNCPLPQDEVFMRTELLTTPHTTMLNWTGKK